LPNRGTLHLTRPPLARTLSGVYAVAIDYDPRDAERFTEPLAYALDRSLIEARNRLSDPNGGPTVVGNFAEEAGAGICVRKLREAGIACTVLAPEEIETDPDRFAVRSFRLGDEALHAASRYGKEIDVPYGEIELLVRGTLFIPRPELGTVEERRFSPTRTLLTGGFITSKRKLRRRAIPMEEREGFLHLYAGDRPALVFREASLHYQALGPALKPSANANFQILVELLRERAPGARYDERLSDKPGRARVLGPTLSPDRHLDVALTLLAKVLRSRPRTS
jgi:hypothetical protein